MFITFLLVLCILQITFEPARASGNAASDPNFKFPIVDFSRFLHGSDEERKQVAKEIGKAAEDIGFLVLINHEVPNDIIGDAWQSTKDFFDTPLQDKLILESADQEAYPFGYSRLGGEILSSGKHAEGKFGNVTEEVPAQPDLKEMFSLGPANPRAGFPARQFPSNPADFERAWTVYYDTLAQLARKVLSAFALALDLEDENYFDQFIDHHASALRALNYPHLEGYVPLPNQLRASAHTDYGTVTILKTDFPGLQVSKDTSPPSWLDVPHIPGAYIVNLGDLMSRWTGDVWPSTLHQVVNPSDAISPCGHLEDAQTQTCSVESTRRQSMAFFHNLNRDAVVATLPIKTSKTIKEYEPIVAGDFLLMKHLAATMK